ncbi:Os02g0627750 [Oryza sativa Japonica Group]|uniref:Os02g0627750 protein n=1 Tax=Oryza sativa subsp. japonica TaxID=39947 RepID=A0A0P0VLY8_ORYSJ|nr:Os02g0627750 [Oryza sativa Japonica Group]
MRALCRRRNCDATNRRSSATSANASTSDTARTVRVDSGSDAAGRGSSAHGRSSSPQNSPAPMRHELKNPDLPPCVVYESRYPRMMNSMESTGSSSRTSRVPLVYSAGRSRSQIASSIRSSISSNSGTCNNKHAQRWRLMSRRMSMGRSSSNASSSTPRVANHLYWWYLLTHCFSGCGICRWFIHRSMSVRFVRHSSSRTIVACKKLLAYCR